MKTLRTLGLFLAVVLASAGPATAQGFQVTGNRTFTVFWSATTQGGTPVLASARFTISNFTNASFLVTVDNVQNGTPTSPNINARLTAFGFGLTPQAATFGAQANGTIYSWAFTNFPAFQRVDVCLAVTGGGCAGGGNGGLNQGQSTPEVMSITVLGNYTNGVTFVPIPAKFQTAQGSVETDGFIIDPPPTGASDLAIVKRDNGAGAVVPGQTITYFVTVTNVGSSPSSGLVTVTETPPAGLTITALAGTGWNCTAPTGPCTRSDALTPAASYPAIAVTAMVAANATPGTVTNIAAVSGGGDSNTSNNTASDPTVITTPAPGMDLAITKTHSLNAAAPGQPITYLVAVKNVGTSASSGTVTVTETPPSGLTITAISGAGWNCTSPMGPCTRNDALAAGSSYPAITVTAIVAANATPGTVANIAIVSGGGDPNSGNNTASDPIIIISPISGSDLAIAKTHSPSAVMAGQTVTYTLTATNVGASASSGTVTVTETPPAGLTISALSGTGWTCAVATRTCTRSDALAPATSYPTITATVSVGANVTPGTVANIAAVSGGSDQNSTNNEALDPTSINALPVPVLPQSFVIGLMVVLLATALYALRSRQILAV
jgi:uncharacterized repeat protein (TIGR01451 family)